MDCIETILTRRSIRRYKSAPISDEMLMKILEAGLAAPSAVNYQPWYFVAIKNKEPMEQLKSIMSRASRNLLPALKERFPTHPDVVEETARFVDRLGGAPVCILAFQLKPDYAKVQSTIIQSVAAAIENMLLAACAMGIGSCWLTAPLEAGVDREIKECFAPDKGDLVALITLGYPESIPAVPRRKQERYTIL